MPTMVMTGAKLSARPRMAGSSLGGDAAPAGHAEGRQAGRAEVLALEQREQLAVLRVAGREAGLEVVDAELGQAHGHGELLAHREAEPLALHAVAQGGVVDGDALGHGAQGERVEAGATT